MRAILPHGTVAAVVATQRDEHVHHQRGIITDGQWPQEPLQLSSESSPHESGGVDSGRQVRRSCL